MPIFEISHTLVNIHGLLLCTKLSCDTTKLIEKDKMAAGDARHSQN